MHFAWRTVIKPKRSFVIQFKKTKMAHMPAHKPVALIILDGWGLAPPSESNAVSLARTPHFDRIWQHCPKTTLNASGEAVGLPEGQMGNSEVGHTNLGAGRVVYQPSTLISKHIREGTFFENQVLKTALGKAKQSRLHLMGLVSDGGVHSRLDHLLALLDFAKRTGVDAVYVHAFTDGRDTSPTGGATYLGQVQRKLDALSFQAANIASVIGRYWAMDRDKRWERTQKAYRALRFGEGDVRRDTPEVALKNAYRRDETDEFIQPMVFDADGVIRDGDVVVFFNFRPDRARQISHAFTDDAFDGFDRGQKPNVHFVGLTRYESALEFPVAFPPQDRLPDILGEVVSRHNLKQFRCAETEKYAHVTYFFNNGLEAPFPGEDQRLIPSPKVATYDLQPEMSAAGVTQAVVEAIQSERYGFILVNFANPDMVGHTGDIPAAVKAVEAADAGLGQILETLSQAQGQAIVVADHGNAEVMRHPDGSPHTAHTTNPVPCVYVGPQTLGLENGGKLGDVAPTLLKLMNIPQPEAMTGRCLIQP